MKNIYQKALDRCKKIFEKYEEEWEKITARLLEKETLSGEEIERIIHHLPEPEVVVENELESEEVVQIEPNTTKEEPTKQAIQRKLENGTI